MLRFDDRVAEQVSAPSGGAAFAISSSAAWNSLSGLPGAFKTFAATANVASGDQFLVEAFDSSGNSALILCNYSTGALAIGQVLSGSNGTIEPTWAGTVTIFCACPSLMFMPQFVSAAGTTLGTATPLLARRNVCVGGSGGFSLLGLMPQTLINRISTAVNLWPPSGVAIEDLSTGSAWSVGPGDQVTIIPYNSTQWFAAQ